MFVNSGQARPFKKMGGDIYFKIRKIPLNAGRLGTLVTNHKKCFSTD